MPSEHEFLRLRLATVKKQLQQGMPDIVFERTGRGRHRTTEDIGTREESIYKREARLLNHILVTTQEGQVLTALARWRTKFGIVLSEHRQQYWALQEQYDSWWGLPPYQREHISKPRRPPLAHYTDQTGQDWIIDDRFLHLLDNLRERLGKWMTES